MQFNIKTISYDARQRVFTILCSASLLACAVYIYAMLSTVYHTVARENLVNLRSELSVQVSELEYQDIALRNEVGLDTALAKGFSEVRSPLYVSRTRESLTLNSPKALSTR